MTRPIGLFFLIGAVLAWGMLAGGCGGRASTPEHHTVLEAKARLIKGQEWFVRGCPGEAELFFKEAVGAARLTDNQPLLVQAQNNLGAALTEEGRFSEAAQWLEKALNLALSLPGQPGAHQILNNLGTLAYQNGPAGRAEDFWRRALQAAQTPEALKRNDSPALPWINLARSSLARGDQEQARLYLGRLRAWPLTEAEEALLLNLEGELAFQNHLYDEAQAKLERAAALNRKQARTRELARNLSFLGQISLKRGHGAAAASYLDRAFFLWAGLGDYQRAREVCRYLEESRLASGRPESLSLYLEVLRDEGESPLVWPVCP